MDYLDASGFEKLYVQNVFLPKNKRPAVSNTSGLKSVFEKLRFRVGLVWTVGLTVEIKQRFQFLRSIVDGALEAPSTSCNASFRISLISQKYTKGKSLES